MTNSYYISFTASEALYEEGAPLHGTDQVEELRLGPFPDYVELTYASLRVGPDGDTIAVYEDGLWNLGLARVPQGNGWHSIQTCDRSLLFSDVTIYAASPEPEHPAQARYLTSGDALELALLKQMANTDQAAGQLDQISYAGSAPRVFRDAEPVAGDAPHLRLCVEYSTAHISNETNDLLFTYAVRVPDDPTEQAPVGPLRASVYRTAHGFLIRVPADFGDEAAAFRRLPSDIASLLALAQRRGADWLVLDADGPTDADLPTFDW